MNKENNNESGVTDKYGVKTTPGKEFAEKKGEVVLREHVFDGIQEYDQKMPNWWLTILWLSIAFFFVYYLVYYSFGLLPTSTESMDARVEAIAQQRVDAVKRTLDSLDDSILVNQWGSDTTILAKGQEVYNQHCVACHAPDMNSNNGLTARPLTDGVWHYGDKPMDVFNIILTGTPKDSEGYKMMRMEKWGEKIGPEKVAQVTAYILSKNPDDFAKFKK